MSEDEKPTLIPGLPTAEDVAALVEKLTGRKTSPEELEKTRQKLAKIAETIDD